MKYAMFTAVLSLFAASAGCNDSNAAITMDDADASKPAGASSRSAVASIVDSSGQQVGHAEFSAQSGGVMMTLRMSNIDSGSHALHVHANGDCGGADFKAAGGHFNPTHEGHGLGDEAVDGSHMGDMTNVVADARGEVRSTRFLPDVTLDPNAPQGSRSLLREGGTAIVVHEEPDDYRTNPAGAAGTRIACGVVSPAPEV